MIFQFQSIFGTKPFAYSDTRNPKNNGNDLAGTIENSNVKQKDEELAKRFELPFFWRKTCSIRRTWQLQGANLVQQAANETVSDTWVAETVNNLPYDGNDDEIDLLFAETENANEGDLIDSSTFVFSSV